MVAFGAATMLARMYPRARWVFYVIAWGCGVTRMVSRAHYLSDVTFGALLGWAVGWGVWMQWGPEPEDRGPKTEGEAAGGRTPEAG
jgi:membrane-associated phospholipid phosphatase